ncbi:MAG: alanine racemase [Clostridia bacterium]
MNELGNFANRTWAEIDLDCIAHNVKHIRALVSKRTEILGVVKADAYGHGVLDVAQELLQNGVERLAVSMLDEAIQLRQSGIQVPILVLSYTDPRRVDQIIAHQITQTVYHTDLAKALSAEATRQKKNVKIHIKIDTGMTRVGFMSGYSIVDKIASISQLPGIIIEGLFTHFATADDANPAYTEMQFERFMSICAELGRVGVHIPVKHVANSAAILKFPHMHLDMVRPGLILFGLSPFDDAQKEIASYDLKPAMQIKSYVIMNKEVDAGIDISYGRTFTTSRKSQIVTVPIGYADGYMRALSNKAFVLINGQKAPVVGRVCMDQCMVDVTDISGSVSLGDEVVLIGTQGNASISAAQVATFAGTINYEIVCLVGKRIPRIYFKNGKAVNVLNYLV